MAFTVEETRLRRSERWRGGGSGPRHLPFLNDALASADPDRECRVDALLWQPEVDDGVRYLPSSPTRHDVAQALGWLYREERPLSWLRRLCWVLDELLQRRTALRGRAPPPPRPSARAAPPIAHAHARAHDLGALL